MFGSLCCAWHVLQLEAAVKIYALGWTVYWKVRGMVAYGCVAIVGQDNASKDSKPCSCIAV